MREVTAKEIADAKKEIIKGNMKLDVVRALQTSYPMLHVGRSIGLFLHGLNLKRWNSVKGGIGDIDMVSPYFILPQTTDEYKIEIAGTKASANDFDQTFLIQLAADVAQPDGKIVRKQDVNNWIKCDYKIDPYQRYEIIELDGFKYKVSLLETIVEAKIRYAMKPAGQKHKDDMYELLGKIKN